MFNFPLVTKKTCLLKIKSCIFIDVKQKIRLVHCGCQKLTKDSLRLFNFWETKQLWISLIFFFFIHLLRLISQYACCSKYKVTDFSEESLMKWAECLSWDYKQCYIYWVFRRSPVWPILAEQLICRSPQKQWPPDPFTNFSKMTST